MTVNVAIVQARPVYYNLDAVTAKVTPVNF